MVYMLIRYVYIIHFRQYLSKEIDYIQYKQKAVLYLKKITYNILILKFLLLMIFNYE